jgi:hypothetical protein
MLLINWWGGGGGVGGWLSPGGRYTRLPDPGRGHTPTKGGGQGELLVWPKMENQNFGHSLNYSLNG